MRNLDSTRLRKLVNYNHETGIFTWLYKPRQNTNAGDVAGYKNDAGYQLIKIDGYAYRAHRLAWLYTYGKWPEGQIDHINQIKHDNRIVNLRDVTVKQNQENRPIRTDNSSGCTGVSWNSDTSKWRVVINSNGKNIHLGLFENFDDAVSERRLAEQQYWTHSPVLTIAE